MKTKDEASICMQCDGIEFMRTDDGGEYKTYYLHFICGKCLDPITGEKIKCEQINPNGDCEHYKFYDKWEDRKPNRAIYNSWGSQSGFWNAPSGDIVWLNKKYSKPE
jgi:hypothetical protein